MSQPAAKGIALEFGKSLYLRPFREPEEITFGTGRWILYAANSRRLGGGRKLLRACQSIREVFRRHENFQIPVVLLDRRLPEVTGQEVLESIRKAQASDEVVLLCDKELRRWSVAEKTNFDRELESAIDFLSQLASADIADQEPPGDADSER